MKKLIKIIFLIVPLLSLGQEQVPVEQYTDRNWSSYISYDLAGNTLSKGLNYFNYFGNADQSQTWDVLTGKIWAGESRYDNFNRPAITTLNAPVDDGSLSGPYYFKYRPAFIRTDIPPSSGTYTPLSLDNYDTSSTLYNPPKLSNANDGLSSNTLGWYYSDQNTYDPYQDQTDYPYLRTIYSILNPGTVLGVVGGNKVLIDRNKEEWVQQYIFQMRLEKPEGTAAFYDPFAGREVVKTVVRDVHGIETVMFTDTDGNTLSASRSGNEDFPTGQHRPQSAVYSEILDNGFVDIHIPNDCGGLVTVANLTPDHNVRIHDLITEELVPVIDISQGVSLLPGFYRFEDQNNFYGEKLEANDPVPSLQVHYNVNYYDQSTNEFDNAGRMLKSNQIIGLETNNQYNSLSQLMSSTGDGEGSAAFKYRKDGQIRFSQNSEQALQHHFSYTNYDELGRPIETGVYLRSDVLFQSLDPIVDDLDGLPLNGRSEQLFTVYDVADSNELPLVLNRCALPDPDYKQTFLSGNVSYTYTQNPNTNKTWYSYDVYGRVRWVIQKMPDLECLQTLEYTYDPINSNVTRVEYQKHTQDRFIHMYDYDMAGHLTTVKTSIDDNPANYTRQARYKYNESGSLVRTELGRDLQGIDYTYNLNGQLKAINHPSIDPNLDPGNDGPLSAGHNGFAPDVFGMALDYHQKDYLRLNSPRPITTSVSGQDQFNGNIKASRWNTQVPSATQNAYTYQYHKNNWLSEALYGNAAADAVITASADYVEKATYDPNGNILTLKRNGYTDGTGTRSMDALEYHYDGNKLQYVKDPADNPDTGRYKDIRDQELLLQVGSNTTAADNYLYNSLGQLLFNVQEKVGYKYCASGQVSKIYTTSPTETFELLTLENWDYEHTGSANSEINKWSTGLPMITTAIGLQDAGCTDIATYPHNLGLEFLDEGTSETKIRITSNSFLQLGLDVLVDKNLYNTIPLVSGDPDTALIATQQSQDVQPKITVTLKKPTGVPITSWEVYANSSTDPQTEYCGHLYLQHLEYTYTSTTSEEYLILEVSRQMQNPVTGVLPRLKQRMLIDNVKVEVATQDKVTFYYNDRGQRIRKQTFVSPILTNYVYYIRDVQGNVIAVYNRTVTGLPSDGRTETHLVERTVYGIGRIGIFKGGLDEPNYTLYELTDHLGNVRAVIRKLGSGALAMTAKADYYPFGMPMPAHQVTDSNYRYEFQGQEKDPETGMEAFELRLWEGRLGRWLTVDPMGQYDSPYLGMGNNPINRIDPSGGSDGGPGDDDPIINLFKPLDCVFGGYNSTVNSTDNVDFSWQPLTKNILIDYLSPKYPGLSKEALYSTAGQSFEKAATTFLMTNTLLNGFVPSVDQSSESIPDGYSSIQVSTNKGVGFAINQNYVEMKTKDVTLTKQIRTFINELKILGDNPLYSNKPVSLTFVTLADNSINWAVKTEIDKQLGLNGPFSKMVHIITYYKMTDGHMRISLQEKGQSPSSHFFSNDVILK